MSGTDELNAPRAVSKSEMRALRDLVLRELSFCVSLMAWKSSEALSVSAIDCFPISIRELKPGYPISQVYRRTCQ